MSRADILDELFAVIDERRSQRPEGSYVVQLLDGGVEAVAVKLREECEEVVEAAASGDRAHTAREVADLLFHAWVMLAASGITPGDVYDVLRDRFGVGGLVEKASRRSGGGDAE